MLGMLLIFVLLVALAVCLPNWFEHRRWGLVPSVVSGILLVAAVAMVFLGRL